MTSDKKGQALELFDAVCDDFPQLSRLSFRGALERNLRRSTVLGAFENDRLAGMLIYSPVLGRISFLAVHPAFRRRGAARELMLRACGLIDGETELYTYKPDPDSPQAAYLLYKSLGFIETGNVPGYREEVIRMVRRPGKSFKQ